ncbi:unnamed protein product [Mortierella alpina]
MNGSSTTTNSSSITNITNINSSSTISSTNISSSSSSTANISTSTTTDAGTNLESLVSFYQETWYLKKKWASQQAQLSCLDIAIKGILRMADKNESDKYNPSGRPVVLCVGLGNFNSQSGLPSKHSVLEARLVKKLKGLGYPVVGCHEYFTSAKCPRPGCDTFLRSIGRTRSRYCPTCRMHFVRDAVGGENIGWICQAQLETQQRPVKYMPAPRPLSFPSTGPSTAASAATAKGS